MIVDWSFDVTRISMIPLGNDCVGTGTGTRTRAY